MKTAEFLSLLAMTNYAELQKSEALWISADWNKGMYPDGDDAK